MLVSLVAQFLLRARDWEQKTSDDKRAHEEALGLLKQIGYKDKWSEMKFCEVKSLDILV